MSISQPLRIDLASAMPLERIFQKYIVDGRSFLFNQLLDKCDWEYELRDELARALDTNINDVVIVGSSKSAFQSRLSASMNLITISGYQGTQDNGPMSTLR
jgi:hypothetical protein